MFENVFGVARDVNQWYNKASDNENENDFSGF